MLPGSNAGWIFVGRKVRCQRMSALMGRSYVDSAETFWLARHTVSRTPHNRKKRIVLLLDRTPRKSTGVLRLDDSAQARHLGEPRLLNPIWSRCDWGYRKHHERGP